MTCRAFVNWNIFVSLFLSAALLLPTFAHAQTPAFSFSKSHSLWDTGTDIRLLQQFLNAQGFVLAQSGAGSPGHETTTFGPLTYKALVKFQAAHQLPATGFFGPLTRTLTNDVVASNGDASFNAATGISAPSASSQSTAGAATTTASTTPPITRSLPGYVPGQIIFIGGSNTTNNGGSGGGSNATPDTNAPTTPISLAATVASASQINLSWSASSDDVGVTGYKVYRDGTLEGTTNTTSYADTGLSPSSLHSYWVAAYDAAGNLSTTSSAVSALANFGADAYGTTWKPLRIGAGGFTTGIDIAPDGTKIVRTDTYGAYLWDGTQWDQLVTANSMPAAFVNPHRNSGVYEIRVAPSNSNYMYMEYRGYVLRSENRGTTWTLTNFPLATWVTNENDSYRTLNHKLAVDPNNPNIVVVGTPENGLYVTTNAGNTWTAVSTSSVPASTAISGVYPGMLVAFDPSSSVISGATQGIYVTSYGNGVYHSTDGGVTWTELNTSGMPTTFGNLVVGQDGVVYVADNSTNNLHIYSSGSWSSVIPGGNANVIATTAVDPSNVDRIVVVNAGGNVSVSTDHAATFTGYTYTNALTTADVPWLAGIAPGFLAVANAAFDPTASSTLYMGAGFSVWVTNPSNTWNTSEAWNSQAKGLEQLVTTKIISPPGGQPLAAVEDRGVFLINNPDVFPLHSQEGPTTTPFSQYAGWDIDYASNNPNYIAGLFNWSTDHSSYSTNGGQTWTQFATMPPNIAGGILGGAIAAASSTDILVFPSESTVPYYTLDGGNTWNPISIAGVPTSGETGWGFSEWNDREIVAADRVNIGTFYAYNYGPTQAPSAAGFYKSTDGGVTWSHVYTSALPASGFNAQMKTVPGAAGELYFTSGYQSGDTTSSPVNEAFYRSTNGGTTWTAIPNVQEVYSFGFGKAAPGTTTPAIYMVGFVNSQYGIYESDDNANTWTQIGGAWPNGSLDGVRTVSGDMNNYGRVYIGFGGSGYVYGDTANAQIAPIISNISSGTPTTTSTVITWTTDQSSNSEVVYGTTTNYGSSTSNTSLITSHSITLTGLSSGTTYHFEVVSADANGYTSTSTDQTFTTYNSTPPSVPTGLTPTATSSSEIDLSWNASTGDGTYPVAGYQIFRNGTQVGTTTSGTAYADTGLSASTIYSYTIAAYDTGGNVSTQTASVSTSTQAGVTFTPTDAPPIQNINFASNTATFSNVNIGTAASDRIVVVGVGNGNSSTDGGIASVTIGGVSATMATTSDPGKDRASLWYATVTSGTTANIVVACTINKLSLAGITVGDITGASTSTPSGTGVHLYNSVADPQAIPSSGTVTVPHNGAAVVFGNSHSPGSQTVTWTGASSVAGDWYTHTEAGNTQSELMAHAYRSGADSFTVAGSIGNGFSGFGGVAAVWGPQ